MGLLQTFNNNIESSNNDSKLIQGIKAIKLFKNKSWSFDRAYWHLH